MRKSCSERRNRDEGGFTLIELMVVVLIIAILLAIAIPTFLGARERAQDRAAQSDIRNALTAEKVYFTDTELFTENGTGTPITSIEPSLTYVNGAAGSTTAVGLWTSTANTAICIGKESKGGKKFSIIEVATGPGGGTWYAKTSCLAAPADAASTAATGPSGYVKTGF